MRIRITKDHEEYRKGQVLVLPQSKAKLLIKQGVAVISKDITNEDIKIG